MTGRDFTAGHEKAGDGATRRSVMAGAGAAAAAAFASAGARAQSQPEEIIDIHAAPNRPAMTISA